MLLTLTLYKLWCYFLIPSTRVGLEMAPSSPPSVSSIKIKEKEDASYHPTSPVQGTSHLNHGDAALTILGDGSPRRDISPEEDAKVLRKIDLWVMPVVLLVYFLQQLDKCDSLLCSYLASTHQYCYSDRLCHTHLFLALSRKLVGHQSSVGRWCIDSR